ncbi:MAG: hypothetical protein UY03_C0021G0014 [Parcubacteria group bacterium GW2011_GWA2_47_64]|nr:MAG: hypothetical protein UY03_C0021G0014 [Parcubacteria group bacterium GW2011_GWA2_47_64]KKU95926.1 MAG: hypothetical protein UY29_C0018G0009 [Parcubacteria group bacterium GW2011_GWC2_48_17]
MVDKETVSKKLTRISEYLDELMPFLAYDNHTLKTNKEKLRNVERIFQLIVDEACDINSHIIAEKNFELPDDYRGSFTILGQRLVLPLQFAEKIGVSVGLRNGIVHRYEKMDVDRMLNDIRQNIGDYTEYVRHIKNVLDKEK